MNSLVEELVALERSALDRWITYFDPMREARVDGLDAMSHF